MNSGQVFTVQKFKKKKNRTGGGWGVEASSEKKKKGRRGEGEGDLQHQNADGARKIGTAPSNVKGHLNPFLRIDKLSQEVGRKEKYDSGLEKRRGKKKNATVKLWRHVEASNFRFTAKEETSESGRIVSSGRLKKKWL